jgi:hypothetical protein
MCGCHTRNLAIFVHALHGVWLSAASQHNAIRIYLIPLKSRGKGDSRQPKPA